MAFGQSNKPIDPNGGGNMVDCVEFEELNPADVYGVGDVFSVANSDGSLKFDAKVGGFGISGVGSATVENGGKAGAMGQELRVDNVTVSFKTSDPCTRWSVDPFWRVWGHHQLFGEWFGDQCR